jgi:hypothetical protein
MGFLSFNGIDMPVRANSVRLEMMDVGERGQAFDGTPYSTIRKRLYKMSLTTPPITVTEARAWEALLGRASNWDFENANNYSRQGLPASTMTGAGYTGGSQCVGVFSLYVQGPSGGAAALPIATAPTGQWSAAFMRRYNGVLSHHIVSGSGYMYVNGAQTAMPTWCTCNTTTGLLWFTSAPLGAYYDEIWHFPAGIPSLTWVQQIYSWQGANAGRVRFAFPLMSISCEALATTCVGVPRVIQRRPLARVAGSGTYQELDIEIDGLEVLSS